MSQKTFPSFISYLQDSKKYIWIFLFSQLFPALFYVFNNGRYQKLFALNSSWPTIIGELIKVSIVSFIILSIFIIIGYIAKYFFGDKYKKVLIALIVLNFIGNTIDLFLYLNFGTQMVFSLFPIFLETNRNEAQDFLSTYFNDKLIFILIYYLIGILMFLEVKKQVFLTGLILSVITILISVNFLTLPAATHVQKNNFYVRTLQIYNEYKKNISETQKLMASLDEKLKNINVTDSVDQATYVLIIGESSSRNHSSLYGYPRETSPTLKKRYENGELFKFNDVVSPHNNTRDAVLKIVTDYAYDSGKKFGESFSIIDLFKKAGYKTYWLSNQDSFDDYGAGLTSIIDRTDENKFTERLTGVSKHEGGSFDDSLLPILDKVLEDKAPKKFIVIHLMGSHFQYNRRYPKDFTFFPENAEEPYFSDLQKKHKDIVNQYHNSIRYNDYIVDQIIQNVDNNSKNSFIIYLSDHGQIVYDDNINLVGHGFLNEASKTVEIPMVIWTSSYYREHNKEKIEHIKNAENKPFASEDVIYPIIDLANLKYDGYKPEKDLFNGNFKEKQRQVSSEGLIYKKNNIKQ